MDNPDQKRNDLVPSGKNELTTSAPLVSRGLGLARNITGYKASLLWVDDCEDILSFVKQFWGKRGYKVTVFKNGLDALEHLKREKYDLLVTDIRNEEINGLDLLKKVKQFKPELMTMVFSGSVESLKEEIMALGCVACFQKGKGGTPLEQIEATIEKALGKGL